MPVWKFRNNKIAYPSFGLLECVMRSRSMPPELLSDNPLESPFNIAGMKPVAQRLAQAVANREKVLVFGDYDCDGVCSTYIMCSFLKRHGVRAEPRFPRRQDGYGIRPEHVQQAVAEGYQLIVTVDNGISALKAAEAACSLGIPMVITDHHEPQAILPELPLADPKLPGNAGYRDYSGAGVAYQACRAVCEMMRLVCPEDLLDLVSLATVVDVCPITGENYRLARKGLLLMRSRPRPGIAALLRKAGSSRINGRIMGWVLGPRLNAAGRANNAELAYRILAAESEDEAEAAAQEIEAIRRERQEAVRTVTAACLSKYNNESFAFFASSEWSEGVIGIAAGRIVDEVLRPAAVGAISGDLVTFSARSLGGFDLVGALEECQERTGALLSHGGHKLAAGFSLHVKDLVLVRDTLYQIAGESLQPEDLVQWLEIDARLDRVPTPREVLDLDLLEPYGYGNPEPVFYLRDRAVVAKSGPGWYLVKTSGGMRFFSSQPPESGVIYAALSLAIDEFRGNLGVIGRSVDLKPIVCDRKDLLSCYPAWRAGKSIPEWAESIFCELGFSRTGSNEKTSLFRSPTFLKYGSVSC